MNQQFNDIQVKNVDSSTQSSIVAVNDERTKHAYDFVKDYLGNKEKEKDLRSLARSFPTMVQNNGLCAAVAFLIAKNKEHHSALRQTIENWLVKRKLISLSKVGGKEESKVLEAIINLSRDQYRVASGEVMTYMQWVKLFAEGMLSDDEKK